jgi:AraC-like DNA-binding protein
MNPGAAPSAEQVTVHPAPAALASWCLCAIVRHVGAGPVRARIQASTWASLNVIAQGEVHGPAGVLPGRFVTSPFTRPFDTCTPGPLLALCLVLQPWALEPLTGIAAGAVGRLPGAVPLAASTGADRLWDAMHDACDGADLSGVWAALQALHPKVQEATPSLALDTLAAAGVEAAATAQGWSTRHYLRRFRHAMGLSAASWVRIRRWETALRDMSAHGAPSIAQLSVRHGFADQAHLSRDTRELLGETPVRLRSLLQEDGGPWSLRPAHVRFVQDEEDTRA